MSENEKVPYVGTCSQLVEKKGGWYQVQISVPGKQYPIKAETKLEHLIAKAREVRDAGTIATWTVEEWDSENINPNTGKPYRERRLSAVEDGAVAPAGGNGVQAQPIAAHHDPVHDADRQRLITRQTCLKVAGTIYQGQALSSRASDWDVPLDVMRAAHRFEQWLYRDIDEVPFRVSDGDVALPAEAPAVDEAEVERLAAEYGQEQIPTDDIPY